MSTSRILRLSGAVVALGLLLGPASSPARAGTVTDDFSTGVNYLTSGVGGTIWDGIYNQSAANILNTTEIPGELKIGSSGGNVGWDGTHANAPFLYKNVTGDFDVRVKVTAGFIVNYTIGGLLVRLADPTSDGTAGEDYVMATYNWFGTPWNQTRSVNDGAQTDSTPSPPDAQPYLRLTRTGSVFNAFRRTDGTAWTAIDLGGGANLTRTDLAGTVQVGLTEGNFSSAVTYSRFDNFSLITPDAVLTWANGANGNWITGAWSGGPYPIATTAAVVNTPWTVTVDSSRAALSLSVSNGGKVSVTDTGTLAVSGLLVLAGGTFEVASGGTASADSVTLTAGDITGSGTLTSTSGFTMNNAAASSASAVLGGSVALTKSGAGTLTLSGANTYTGLTTVNGGTLLLDMTGSGALSSSSALTLGGGVFSVLGKSGANTTAQTLGALTLTASTDNKIVLDPNGGTSTTLTLGNAWTRGAGSSLLIDYSSANSGTRRVVTAGATTTYTLNNGIYGGILVKDSAGVTGFATRAEGTNIAITRYDDTTGTTLVNNSNSATTNFTTLNTVYSGGTLNWNSGFTNRSVNSLTIDTTNNGGTIDMGGSANILTLTSLGILFKGSNNATLQGGQVGAAASEVIVHQTGAGTLTLGSLVSSGAGRLTKDGPGALIVSNSNTYTGATNINQGTLKLGAAGSGSNTPLGTTATGTTVAAGGALDLNGYTLATAEALTLNGTGVSGGGALTNSSATAATYSGLVTLGSNGVSIVAGSGNIVLSNTGTITGAGFALTVGGAGNTTINSIIGTTTGTLTKTGAGTLTLAGANTYSGGTTLSGGILTAANNNALGTGDLTVSGGTTATRLVINNGVTIGNNITFNGGGPGSGRGVIENNGTVNATLSGGTITINSNTTNGGHFGYYGSTGTLTINDPIISTVPVMHRGGTVIYGGGGSYAKLSVMQDTARLGADNGLSTSGTLDMGSNGPAFFDLAGHNQSLAGITTATASNATVLNSGTGTPTLTINNTADITFPGVLGAGGTSFALAKTGNGTLTLSGANTYTGGTTVNAGTLVVGVGGSLSASTTVTVDGDLSTCKFDAGGNTVSVAGVNLYGGILAATGPGSIRSSGTFITESGTVTAPLAGTVGTVGLTKQGLANQTVTLSAANTYTGPTDINAGTLKLDATGSIADSSPINLNGGSLDTSAKTTGFIVPIGQTLKGQGNFAASTATNISGSLQIGQTHAAAGIAQTLTVTSGNLTLDSGSNSYFDLFTDATSGSADKLSLTTGSLAYGGTLRLGIVPASLTVNSSWDLFDFTAGNSSGDFAAFDPATPGTDLKWDFHPDTGVLSVALSAPSGNNSQILIASADHSSTETGASDRTIALSRVLAGGTATTASQTINKTGSDSTTYTVTTDGNVSGTGLASGSFDANAQSASGTITLNTSTTGSKTGTVTIHNAGTGVNDADDVFTVTATAVAKRGTGDSDLLASPVDLGFQHAGANLSGSNYETTVSTTGDDDHYTRVTVAGSTDIFNGGAGTGTSQTRTVSGPGNVAIGGGSLTTLAVTTAESGLGEGAYSPVSVAYTASVFSGTAAWAGGSNNWGSGQGGNWTAVGGGVAAAPGTIGGLFTATDTATFPASETAAVVTLDGVSPSLNALSLAGSGGYTIDRSGSSETLSLAGAGASVSVGSGTHAISVPVVLTDATGVDVAATSGLTLSGLLSGEAMTKTGAGTLTLTNAGNSYAGTTVSGGTLVIASAGALPAGKSLTIGSGGTLILGGGMAMGTAASAEPVPEPGTLALLAIAGLAGLFVWRRRQS